ncbi:hypothetical protein D9M68_666480 [compost metagenome]
MRWPVAVLPVKAMAVTSGCTTTASPTVAPSPMTRLTTPAGSPALSMAAISAQATSAVDGAGTQTMALPVAMPGARYSTGMLTGKFQGVMTP